MMSLATEARWYWKTAEDHPVKPHLIKPHLSPEWVGLVRELYNHGNSIMYIHNATGIEPETIYTTVHRKTYKRI